MKMMGNKKEKRTYPTDQQKYNHHEAVKGHKTRRHYLNSLQEEEAEEEIKLEKHANKSL